MLEDNLAKFEDIHAFEDRDVRPTIDKLISDNKFIGDMSRNKFGTDNSFARFFVRNYLRFVTLGVDTTEKFEDKVTTPRAEKVVGKTIEKFTYDINSLNQDGTSEGKIILMNHHDILMDFILLKLALHYEDTKDVRYLQGNNLHKKEYAELLLRLTGGVTVKRDLEGRAAYNESMRLSSYINNQLENGNTLISAIAEGRTKDGNDVCNPAIFTMIYMKHKTQKVSFEEFLEIVPIFTASISYELEPCAFMKANEMMVRELTDSYTKSPGEDNESMIKGLTENKGEVYLATGNRIIGVKTPQEAAKMVESEVRQNYKITDLNYFGELVLRSLNGGVPLENLIGEADTPKRKQIFFEALNYREDNARVFHKKYFQIYANPFLNVM